MNTDPVVQQTQKPAELSMTKKVYLAPEKTEKNMGDSVKKLSFRVILHDGHGSKPDNLSYHMVKGKNCRGLLVDPGASAGLIGSETLRNIMDHCLQPRGPLSEVSWKSKTSL